MFDRREQLHIGPRLVSPTRARRADRSCYRWP
jgi:hypothetical protein